MRKKIKSKCDERYSMAVNVRAQGCGCPACAAEENSTSADAGIKEVINCLRKLAEAGRLLVWDPMSKKCLSGTDIENICANGNSVQIGLQERGE